jgi:hypothetical protein
MYIIPFEWRMVLIEREYRARDAAMPGVTQAFATPAISCSWPTATTRKRSAIYLRSRRQPAGQSQTDA